MARGFRRTGQECVATLDAAERSVIVELLEQTRIVLAPGGEAADLADDADPLTVLAASLEPPPRAEPDLPPDPALARLLPSGHRGDDEVAAEFRRLTEQDLRIHKATCLGTAIRLLRAGEGDHVVVPLADVSAVLVALTDVRLLLADRLGLATEEDVERLERRLQYAQLQYADLPDVDPDDDPASDLGDDAPDSDLGDDDPDDDLVDADLDAGREDVDEDVDPEDPDSEDVSLYVAQFYDFLGWLQETLVHAVL